jgi:hypothetical protein
MIKFRTLQNAIFYDRRKYDKCRWCLPQTVLHWPQCVLFREATMLTTYIRASMRQAHYEIIEDGTYYGEIEGLPGVYANAESLDDCRNLLQEALEGWRVLGLRLAHQLAAVDGIQLDLHPEPTSG